MCIFSLLCLIMSMSGWSENVENEQAEWMWTIPEYLDRIRLFFFLHCFSISRNTLLCVFVLY